MLALRDLMVRREGRIILRLPELLLARGARLALVGASGGGKSTVLRAIAGLVPFEGEIRIEGQLVSRRTLPSMRRRLGYVIQEGGLFPHLSARENVTLSARDQGVSNAAISARLSALSELVSLRAAHLDRAPHELSGGERQRVAIMRALFLEPSLLLLDEPLGALDSLVRRKLQDDLLAIFEQTGATVLLVTHDLEEARFLATDLAVMEDGEIVQRGRYVELETAPASPYVAALVQAQLPRPVAR